MRYDAFISYRHSELDMYVAKKIHKYLETFKVPKSVAKRSGKKKIHRVFRDQEELPIGSDLGNNIEAALAQSEFLIVICSPRTPGSEWVYKEIMTFIAMHGRERVLAVLIEGEPYESFPAPLLYDEYGRPVEPLAADVRGLNKKEINKKLKVEAMRLCAPLLYCNYDDLRQRHRERKMRKIIGLSVSIASIVAVLGISFGFYSSYNAKLIEQNYMGKLENESKYLAQESIELSDAGYDREAALVAIEAIQGGNADRPFVPATEYALSKALNSYDAGDYLTKTARLKHNMTLIDVSMANDGKHLLAIDAAQIIHLWQIEGQKEILTLENDALEKGGLGDIVHCATIVADNSIFVCKDNRIALYDFEGKVIYEKETDAIMGTCLNLDYSRVALYCNNQVKVFDTVSGELIAEFERGKENFSDTGTGAFSVDGKFFGVGCNSKISIYDFESGETKQCKVKGSFISQVSFSTDGKCIVMSDDSDYSTLVESRYIQSFDISTGKKLWTKTMSFYEAREKYSYMKAAKYVVATCGDNTYVYDTETGDEINSFGAGNLISELYLLGEEYGLFCTVDGRIRIIELTTGSYLESRDVETGVTYAKARIKSGVYAIFSYSERDILIMTFQPGKTVEELATTDTYYGGVYYDKEETGYALYVKDSTTNGTGSLEIYDQNAQLRKTLTLDNGVEKIVYYDKDTIVIIYSDYSVGFYSISEDKLTKLAGLSEEESTILAVSYSFSRDNSRLAMIGNTSEKSAVVITYDMEEKKESGKNIFSDIEIAECAIANLENAVYIVDKDGKLNKIDTETMTITPVSVDAQIGSFTGEETKSICISSDDKYMAACCKDGYLRIIDLENSEVLDEIKEIFWNKAMVSFDADGKVLYYCGDSAIGYFYDIENKTILGRQDLYGSYDYDIYWGDSVSDYVVIKSSNIMYIVDTSHWQQIAEIPYDAVFMPKSGKILMISSKTVYKAQYQSYDALIIEAQEKYSDLPLTDFEKRLYNIE